ncbi:amidohydrolase [Robbsia andropogonis]|uniref:Amidohydrolase n=1 Tax=Robbsia andropogonis TaxID=28092 RepID=A0A0F5JTG2_9BURK|nr:amidohydrolase family protein [Robbsia andropogonis]KKB61088.1 amidohydrolase [Robbsia andropogonis]MCP1118679.1 amidohydrolase family protein [Robbsia andropogonis]MCP1128146.1 amidohydrolase family protein [Robbsia andropogonis]
MTGIVFNNVKVFDGSVVLPYTAQVRVQGNRISALANASEPSIALADDAVYDCRGATLLPGLIEAHAHLSWPSSVEKFVPGMSLPPEELVLTTARNARILLDHGFTGAYSAGSLSKRVEVALAEQIDSGGMPGPRLVASSIERTPPVAGDEQQLSAGEVDPHGVGPDAVRAFVHDCAEMGARSVKFLLSGEDALQPGASQQLLYTEAEARAAGDAAAETGVWLAAHAQAAEAVKMALRNDFRVLYHCTYADEEALDMLEAARDRIFVAPAIGIIQATLDATPPPHFDMNHMKRSAAEVRTLQQRLIPELRRRGIRVLPGGDYGFPFNPNGRNARDLQLFVDLFGYTPADALHAATTLGGALMGMPESLGRIAPTYLADLLVVDGDPTEDLTILQDKQRLLGIMKDGAFHKEPRALLAARQHRE